MIDTLQIAEELIKYTILSNSVKLVISGFLFLYSLKSVIKEFDTKKKELTPDQTEGMAWMGLILLICINISSFSTIKYIYKTIISVTCPYTYIMNQNK